MAEQREATKRTKCSKRGGLTSPERALALCRLRIRFSEPAEVDAGGASEQIECATRIELTDVLWVQRMHLHSSFGIGDGECSPTIPQLWRPVDAIVSRETLLKNEKCRPFHVQNSGSIEALNLSPVD